VSIVRVKFRKEFAVIMKLMDGISRFLGFRRAGFLNAEPYSGTFCFFSCTMGIPLELFKKRRDNDSYGFQKIYFGQV
jgi:hypothetical protein